MKKLLKTKKLVVTTETVRNLTDKQLDNVVGGASVATPSNTFQTGKCNVVGTGSGTY